MKQTKRTVSSLLIMGIFCLLIFGNQIYAVDVPVSHVEKSNTASHWYGEWMDTYAASSLGFMGASWSYERDVWEFNYRFMGAGRSQYQDDETAENNILGASMDIKGTSNTSNMYMWSSGADKYLGSAPESSGGNPDYYDEAITIGNFVVTAINSLGASYAWSAWALIDYLRNSVDDNISIGTHLYRAWDWGSAISDTGQYFWFLVDVEPYQTVQLSYEYSLIGAGFEYLSAGKGYRNLEAGAPDTLAAAEIKTSNDWNPGMMSSDEKSKYGIEVISRSQFDKRAAELYISDKTIEEFKNSNEEVFYFAHNFKEYEPSKNESPKEALIQDINTQLERSEKIIRFFSNRDSKDEEDLRIIQKNEREKALLESLLDRTQSINENDTKAIETLRKELWNDIVKENPDTQSK